MRINVSSPLVLAVSRTVLVAITTASSTAFASAQVPQSAPSASAGAQVSGAHRGSLQRGRQPHAVRIPLMEMRRALQAGSASVPNSIGILSKQPAATLALPQAALTINTKTVAANSTGTLETLPLWSYELQSPRDGLHHSGTIVGRDPVHDPGTSQVPTYIVPLVLHTQTIATSVDLSSGLVTATASGATTFDSTVPDHRCMSAPNNVPIKLVAQSPLFQPAPLSVGGMNLGTTQYGAAYQRANLSGLLGTQASNYSVLLNPVKTLAPVEANVPANEGIALTDGSILGPPSFCAPLALVDYNWLDGYLTGTVIPHLAQSGVNPRALPIFILYNVLLTDPTPSFPGVSFYSGYHSTTGFPVPTQSYIVSNFDSTGVFGPALENTLDLSHLIVEWMNAPYSYFGLFGNTTPPYAYSYSSFAGACSDGLEVADPLYPTPVSQVVMPNGFAYNLQEAAFLSWFFGGASFGLNGWYSNNGSLRSDAGPLCP